MAVPTAKDAWLMEFILYVDRHAQRGTGRYTKMLAEQAWRHRGELTGEQAAMRWVAEHAPKGRPRG